MVMDEYLPDISNDMIVCLLRAGTVIIRCEIWKHFLTVRDNVVNKSSSSSSVKNKMTADKSRSKKSKTRTLISCGGISNAEFLDQATNLDDKKCSRHMKSGEDTEYVGHKLQYTSHGFLTIFQLTIRFLVKAFRCLTPQC